MAARDEQLAAKPEAIEEHDDASVELLGADVVLGGGEGGGDMDEVVGSAHPAGSPGDEDFGGESEAALASEPVADEGVPQAVEDVTDEGADDIMLTGAAALAAAPVADDDGAEPFELAEPEPEAPGAEESEAPVRAKKEDDEPQSFLAMYFRDMAELEVLRPEQEFETARNIETLEVDLWKLVLGFPAAAGPIAERIEKAMGKPSSDLKAYRALAEKSKPRTPGKAKSSSASASAFDKLLDELAPKLRELDIDRLFIDAGVAEVARLARQARHESGVPAYQASKLFQDHARTVAVKAHEVKIAKNAFVKANLRLVVSIARRFNHGRLPLADLIQEGNIGLMKAVERYDYRRGFRFSTYASWWIRHAISRALADKGRAVRLPVHMIDAYHRIAKSERELQSKLERPATNEEIASAAGIEADKLEKMRTFLNETPISLDRPISDEDGRRLIDVLADPQDSPSAPEQMVTTETHREMLKLLSSLKPIEADILRKRFGLLNDREQTLKEIGDEYRLSRERVRQLQEQALGKMRKAMQKLESV